MSLDPAPFSAVAQAYDAVFTDTAVGRLQRQIVWGFLEKIAAGPSSHVLEINCGTGEDAVWLAQRGCRVLATDAAAGMVAAARQKALLAGAQIETRVCAFADLARLPERNFDLILSNFGGLNCLPPEELVALGPVLAQKLRPGGRVVLVVMGRFCAWETLYFLLKGHWREAFRRARRGPLDARLDARTTVATWYYSPREMASLLGCAKRRGAVQAVGFWLPPSYLNPFFAKRPRLLRALSFLEKKCRGRLWAWGADHFLLAGETPGLP